MLDALYNPVRTKVTAALVIVLLGVTSVSHIANARPAPESFADLAEKLLPSVVNISTSQLVAERQGPDFQFPPVHRSKIFSVTSWIATVRAAKARQRHAAAQRHLVPALSSRLMVTS